MNLFWGFRVKGKKFRPKISNIHRVSRRESFLSGLVLNFKVEQVIWNRSNPMD
jgi:hypothetical protein